MQLREAVLGATAELEAAGIDRARLTAEVLLLHATGRDRTFLYAHPEYVLSEAEEACARELIARRAAGEPPQYLTGHQEFWGLDFRVTPAVLIPRPETEFLVEKVVELVSSSPLFPLKPKDGLNGAPEFPTQAKTQCLHGTPVSHLCHGGSQVSSAALREPGAQPELGAQSGQPLKIIDVGTGSGAIAVALAHDLPQAEVHAVDLSPEALAVARENAERLGVRVRFLQSDVLEAVTRDGSFDFVVSNPPYVGLNEADKVQQMVKDYEPHLALFAGEEGLTVIRRLIPQAREALRAGGWMLMEIGWSQSEAVMALLNGWAEVQAIPDLAGIPRIIAARKPQQ
ncbi:MAG: peptide chain release factor N(5)-glutamine methyltransferase [Acidobacteriota bacterium]|nr:peptide chain release factor N(5)-glutamine methyltransferase [Acidobacteriota bacterium]